MTCSKLLAVLLAFGCGFSFATPAATQVEIPTGSRVGRPAPASPPDNTALSDEDRALRTTFEYARCLVQRDEKIFREMLSLKPMQLTKRQQKALMQPACLSYGEHQLKMPTQILRGAIFRTFYLKDWAQNPATAFAEPVNYFEFVNREDQPAVATAMMLDFASCVLRTDQANARAFVSGIPGGPQFENALRELIPQLGPCMVEGLEVQFSKSNLAAYLSEALYWEAKAAGEMKIAQARGN